MFLKKTKFIKSPKKIKVLGLTYRYIESHDAFVCTK